MAADCPMAIPAITGRDDANEYRWCCQTNSNKSQFAATSENLCGTKLAPLRESDGSVVLEIVSGVEMSFLIEMVVDGGMNGREFLLA